MKKICKNIILFITHIVNCIHFFILRFKNGNKQSCIAYNKENNKSITLLANGPSLKEYLSSLYSNENNKKSDYIVLNFFAFEPLFKIIKPSHYCLVDPMFFQKVTN